MGRVGIVCILLDIVVAYKESSTIDDDGVPEVTITSTLCTYICLGTGIDGWTRVAGTRSTCLSKFSLFT